DAVIADIGVRIGPCTGKKRELAAEAVADGADLPVHALQLAHMRDRALDVGDALVDVEALHVAERLAPILLGLVGQLNAGLEAPEEIGSRREAAARGMRVANG